uniref:Uncharacterized protein n=1 Tax=Kwoniella dejecticola CBS 10117 TaxID=1296121 RepID=A0A1A6A8N6_9TREE|nr:uncharacterized protein I303_02424 [Kwoniella dejecticola CBS 10117]OBR86417.1 hypothetical protein I303_02424 [Kwoniella dejecticola CBS 10117]
MSLLVERQLAERGGTAPNGQVLADWQTYLSYVTTINDTPYTVTTIANLPLTYYGPSIPLGDGWTYGGLTSPTGTDQLIPPMTSSADQIETTSMPTTLEPGPSIPASSDTSSSPASYIVTSSRSSSSAPSLTTVSSSAALPALSSSGPALTPSASNPSSAFMPNTINDNPTSFPAPSPTPTTSEGDNSTLLASLLGALIPLIVTILVLLIFFCVYQKNRHSRDSRFFGLFSTSRWSSIRPDAGGAATSRKGKSREIGNENPPNVDDDEQGDGDRIKSPNEKSALLPGWTAQHHRLNSDSSEHAREVIIETNDELRDLPKKKTLLQRLNASIGLGLGRSISSGNSKAKLTGLNGEKRIVSGNTLEKGQGNRQGGSRRILSPSAMVSAATAGMVGMGVGTDKKDKRRTAQTSSTGTYERVLDDDQLFFSVPRPNRSSEESRGTGSATGEPSIPHSPYTHQGLTPPAEIRNMASGSFSIGIPYTPNTEAHDVSMDLSEMGAGAEQRRTRWSEDGERIRFPAPPGDGLGLYDDGTFGRPPRIGDQTQTRRESYMSVETEYYSAPSHSSSSHIPSAGVPIPRDAENYRHVSVSAFGSHPSTPTRPTRFSQPGSTSSFQPQRDPSPVRLISPLASPHKDQMPRPDQSQSQPQAQPPRRPVSGIGTTFHSIRNLFSSTPSTTPELTPVYNVQDTGSSDKDRRRSYVGQPIVGERLRGVPRSIGDFGEPLKKGALVAPALVSPRPSHSSERASLHLSIPTSQYHSHSSHTTSGSSNDATTASHEPALRGKRSKGTLLRASKIGELHRPHATPIQIHNRPAFRPEDEGGPSTLGRQQRSVHVANEDTEREREWEWEGEEDIDEFLAEGEELPPLTPDRNGMRDKGLRDSWMGRWSGSSP